jgi:uncharacterized membrane protein
VVARSFVKPPTTCRQERLMSITTHASDHPSVAHLTARGDVVLAGATVTAGLLGGLFYGYACSVMPGLHGASDRTVVDAMQQINRSIQNPVFFVSFLGAPVLAGWAWIDARRGEDRMVRRWIGAGAALMLATLTITFAFNIPLNDRLDRAGSPEHLAKTGQLAQTRDDFENPWVVGNIARTITSVGGFAALAWGMGLRLRRREG